MVSSGRRGLTPAPGKPGGPEEPRAPPGAGGHAGVRGHAVARGVLPVGGDLLLRQGSLVGPGSLELLPVLYLPVYPVRLANRLFLGAPVIQQNTH